MADKSFMDVKVKELPAFVGENLRGYVLSLIFGVVLNRVLTFSSPFFCFL